MCVCVRVVYVHIRMSLRSNYGAQEMKMSSNVCVYLACINFTVVETIRSRTIFVWCRVDRVKVSFRKMSGVSLNLSEL